MQLQPFMPIGAAFIITTTTTTQQTPILLSSLALQTNQPTQIRFFNAGSGTVWVNMSTSAGSTAAIPTAGTTTTGTPQPGFFVPAGEDLVFTIACGWAPITIAGVAVTGFYMNTIATAGGPLYCVLGEGM